MIEDTPHDHALDKAADALTDALSRAEDVLRRQKFGVSASVSMAVNSIPPSFIDLVFGKHDGQWQLFLRSRRHQEVTELFGASLELRALAAQNIWSLVFELRKRKAQRVGELAQITNSLTAFLDELDSKEVPP